MQFHVIYCYLTLSTQLYAETDKTVYLKLNRLMLVWNYSVLVDHNYNYKLMSMIHVYELCFFRWMASTSPQQFLTEEPVDSWCLCSHTRWGCQSNVSQIIQVITAYFSSGVSNSFSSSHILSVYHVLLFIKCVKFIIINNSTWLSIKFVKICQFITIMTFNKMPHNQNQSKHHCQFTHFITLFIVPKLLP